MRSITILEHADQLDAGMGPVIDASALRPVLEYKWTIGAEMGCSPRLQLFVERAPTINGPWTRVWYHDMVAGVGAGQPSVWTTDPKGFDAPGSGVFRPLWKRGLDAANKAAEAAGLPFVRARWIGGGNTNVEPEWRVAQRTGQFRLGLIGMEVRS